MHEPQRHYRLEPTSTTKGHVEVVLGKASLLTVPVLFITRPESGVAQITAELVVIRADALLKALVAGMKARTEPAKLKYQAGRQPLLPEDKLLAENALALEARVALADIAPSGVEGTWRRIWRRVAQSWRNGFKEKIACCEVSRNDRKRVVRHHARAARR